MAFMFNSRSNEKLARIRDRESRRRLDSFKLLVK